MKLLRKIYELEQNLNSLLLRRYHLNIKKFATDDDFSTSSLGKDWFPM